MRPKSNELFLMTLEKAWAKINGGYDQIEGGIRSNIFELFLGCSTIPFGSDNINSLYESVKENKHYFGTLTLCGSQCYEINDNNIVNERKTFNKENALNQNKIIKNGFHAYKILKTYKICLRSITNEFKTCDFFIISNTHGKYSNLIQTGIELAKIEEILKGTFGPENKSQYQHILD